MNTDLEITHLLPNRPETCFVVSGFLSPRACRNFMSPRIKAGFRKASTHYPTYYRNNERRVVDDHRLAGDLFQRLRPYAPETILTGETWRIHSLNERLRFCRYRAGQFFGKHLDGVHYRTRTLESRLTFMIYLNDSSEFRGGRTLFFGSRKEDTILAEYHPRGGDLIIFDHKLWHSGERVDEGEKYILRSDILYERIHGAPGQAMDGPFLPGHLGYVWKILRLKDGRFITGGRDRAIKVWDADGRPLTSVSGHSHSILALEELDGGGFASGSRDGTIKFWQPSADDAYTMVGERSHHEGTILSLRRIDDHRLASSGSDGSIVIQSPRGDFIARLSGHDDWVWDSASIPTGELFSISQDGSMNLWNVSEARLIRKFTEADAPLTALAVAPTQDDSSRVYTGDGEGNIHIWNFIHGEELRYDGSFRAHEGVIRCLAVLNNGGLASGGEDSKVRLWQDDSSGGLPGGSFRAMQLKDESAHADFVQSLWFDAAEEKLYSASYDGRIRVTEIGNYYS